MALSNANDSGGSDGVDVSSHITGDPFSVQVGATATSGHTWIIVVGALVLLWLLGGFFFRSIRMG